MSTDSPSTGQAVAPAKASGTKPVAQGFVHDLFLALRERGGSTSRYLVTTEVHTYAFSVAANAILSFFPLMVVLMTLVKRVFHSQAMSDVIVQLLRSYLPTGQDFIIKNLNAMVNARRGAQLASLLILLVTSSGVFLPLEVALNQVWGIKRNRSYLGNQLISMGLAFSVAVLGLVSVALTAGNLALLHASFTGNTVQVLQFSVMKLFAVLASISIFFLIYWALPNGDIRPRQVMPAALVMGVLWEGAKYLYILVLPWLDFKEVYGPFTISVTLMFWAFISGLLLLAGAHLSADTQPSVKPYPA